MTTRASLQLADLILLPAISMMQVFPRPESVPTGLVVKGVETPHHDSLGEGYRYVQIYTAKFLVTLELHWIYDPLRNSTRALRSRQFSEKS